MYNIVIVSTRCCFVLCRVLSRSMPTQFREADDLRKVRSTVTGNVRNNLRAMSVYCIRILLEDHFCEWHLKDQYLMLTEHLLRLLNIEIIFTLSTSDKMSAPLLSSSYFNAKSAADFYSSSTDLTARASLVTQLRSSQTSLSFSNLY